MSRSNISRSALDQSAVGIATSSAPPNGSSAPSSPPKPPNRSNCPSASLRLSAIAISTALACTATRPCREWPRESNAPALHSDSMTFLLQTTASTLRRKSVKSLNRPCSSRARAIASTTLCPTLRHRGQPEADVGADRGEVRRRLVDVGRQHLDAHAPALGQVDRPLVLVVAHAGEQGGHVLGRVVGLEVGRPVGDQAVGGRVRLVDGVVGERDEDVPERLDRRGGEAALLHAGLEADELRVEDRLLLLAHRAAQQVGLAEGVPGDLLRDRHDLLLVHDQAVGAAEDVLQGLGELRVDRRDLLLAVLAQRVVGVRVGAHRAGPVERADRARCPRSRPGCIGRSSDRIGPAVELEDAERVAPGQQVVGGRVGEVLAEPSRSIGSLPLATMLRSASSMIGEVAQAQEVHLEQAERLAGRVVELRDDGAVGLPAHDRDRVDERERPMMTPAACTPAAASGP